MSEVKVSLKGRVIALLLGCVFLVTISEFVVRAVYPSWSEFYAGRYMVTESVPGHGIVAVGKAGFDGYFAQNNGDFRAHIKINDFGLRNDDPAVAANQRVWILGDSMAFGWGVEADEMYSSVIGELINTPTYNVASPGTNVCGYQALAARMPKDISPAAVVVGLIIENDLSNYDCPATAKAAESSDRASTGSTFNLGTIKQMLSKHSALYNFFAVSLKRVSIMREALIWVGVIKKSHAYRNPLEGKDMEQIAKATANELDRLRNMFDPNTKFVVQIAPARFEIANDDPAYIAARLKLREALTERDISYVDPIDRFKADGFEATHFIHDGHWSAKGHRIAAEETAAWLRSNLPQ